ncbi:jg11628 [Pararge aegeria aegeria]|uniref:Jg11628 protein n=1 Tax=Pararge aegeria aegeria TaxID=348720 RepID=A0A8S4RNP2_9NEOP|nr:jg11628 [Pararge aegeria aegeria]
MAQQAGIHNDAVLPEPQATHKDFEELLREVSHETVTLVPSTAITNPFAQRGQLGEAFSPVIYGPLWAIWDDDTLFHTTLRYGPISASQLNRGLNSQIDLASPMRVLKLCLGSSKPLATVSILSTHLGYS